MKANTLRREGDNVSVTSGFSSLTEDATLQEAYMGAVSDGPTYVLILVSSYLETSFQCPC